MNNPLITGSFSDDEVFVKPPAACLRSTGQKVRFALLDSHRTSKDRGEGPGQSTSSTTSSTSTMATADAQSSASGPAVVARPSVPDVYAPPVFRGDDKQEAAEWLKHFERYTRCKGMSQAEKLAFFPLSLGGAAEDWYDSLEDASSINTVIEQFKKHFGTERLDAVLRGKSIFSHEQKPGEKTRDYVCTMKKLAGQLTNIDAETLWLATLKGLQPHIRRYAIQQGCKNLQDLLKAARAAELSAGADSTDLTSLVAEVRASRADLGRLAAKVDGMAVNVINPRPSNSRPATPPTRSPSPAPPGRRVTFSTRAPRGRAGPAATRSSCCYRCGRDHWGKPCPVINLTCFNCNKRGHVSNVCMAGRRQQQ